ncbi:hypothetical protein AMK68_03940 [candidate division KD3-62 bacterium DG_56]|uniref:HTH crp-type domain-containing protein n=1 Tax=candidate division KD3-62 bacterium DG_56 TaxID=1704032 RepID=A0A0S7XLR0_9BACT|nr:MAG: hypothetical protein AMK68_03940 [candidate division KD3-62 bacterium DG_56]
MRSTDRGRNVRDAAEEITYGGSSISPSQREAVENCPLIAQLPREARPAFIEAARVRRYARHDAVVRYGEPVADVFCMLRGLVRLWLIDVDGNDYTVETGWPGSVSLVSLGAEGGEWPWNGTIMVPSTLLLISCADLAVLRRRCAMDDALMTFVSADFRRRIVWHGLLRSVRLRPRLLLILRRMGDELGRRTEKGTVLDFPVTQNDLAQLASVTRDEVGRAMREFRDDGLITPIGRRGLLIPDLDALGPPAELPWAHEPAGAV